MAGGRISPVTTHRDNQDSQNDSDHANRPSTSFTLTFNGVNFQLTPTKTSPEDSNRTSANHGSTTTPVVTIPSITASDIQLNLHNFTGTLTVSSSAGSPALTTNDQHLSSKQEEREVGAGSQMVEDEPSSPPHHNTPEDVTASTPSATRLSHYTSAAAATEEHEGKSFIVSPKGGKSGRGKGGQQTLPFFRKPARVTRSSRTLGIMKKGGNFSSLDLKKDDKEAEGEVMVVSPPPTCNTKRCHSPSPSKRSQHEKDEAKVRKQPEEKEEDEPKPKKSKTVPIDMADEIDQNDEDKINENTPLPSLGQLSNTESQLSQTGPSCSPFSGTSAMIEDTSSSPPDLNRVPEKTRRKVVQSPTVREIVQKAESDPKSQDKHESDEDDSENEGDNENNNTIMELDDCLLAEDKDAQEEEEEEEENENKADEKTGRSSSISASHVPESLTKSKIKNDTPPCPRWGQTMTLIDHSRIIVYGGQAPSSDSDSFTTLSDIHVYDIAKQTWTKPVNCHGVPRTWHTATFLPERQLLISFGGESTNPKTGRVSTTDEVMVLDTDIMLWYPPSVTGSIPSGRSGHTASLLCHTNELVVFGGVRNRKWLNSVSVLDTTRWKWSVPKIMGMAPRPRSYHSATPIGLSSSSSSGNGGGRKSSGRVNRLVIFGGNNDDTSFNTVHVLDATDGNKWRWFHPDVKGTAPCPRTGHCATLLEDNRTILIYGGWDPCAEEDEENSEEEIFQDSFLLDTETWTWKPGPKPRYTGGGSNRKGAIVAPNGGPKRVGHSAVLAPGEQGAEVLVFGGRIPDDEFASDFQTLVAPRNIVGLG